MLQVGQTLSLVIDKPAAGGRMIARADGQVILVSGAIPGERVVARLERIARGVAYAETASVDEPSADRRPVHADPSCGGCLYAHIAYPRQLEIKARVIEDAFARIGHLDLPSAVTVAGSPEEGYRMRARLHLRGGEAGFFREETHDLCPARITRQLRADTCDALDRLAAGLRSLGAAHVRELELSENIDASARVVHLESDAPHAIRTLSGLGSSDGLTGLTVSDPRVGAAVIAGDPYVTDSFAVGDSHVSLRRHVLAFFQGNRYLLPSLVAHVVQHTSADARLVDLYAGVGLFAVSAAIARSAHVIAVEGDRAGAADLAANAAAAHGQVTAVHQAVEQFVTLHAEPVDVLIVDPPRTGMSKEALLGAIALGASRVVYVSCDVATLARDAGRWVQAGYRLEQVTGFDLFPNTPHVEAVAVFGR